jgi:uncharacterized Zn finger protein
MAHPRELVVVLPLFALRLSLVHSSLARSKERELTMRCRCCGEASDQARETVPYVGPGPRVVELRDVQVLRCTGCGQMSIELPQPQSLDVLVRCLASELSGTLPQLTFDQGRWCIVPRPPSRRPHASNP